MEFTELQILDPESQAVYKLKLSHDDAVKAENVTPNVLTLPKNDTACCSSAENENLAVTMDISAMDSSPIAINTEEEDNSINNTEEELGEGFRWSHEGILLLIEEYRQREQEMKSGKITQKKAWEQIAQELNNKGYKVTGKQCTTRVNTMKRTYKSIKDHNNKSGNDKRSWKYFELMDNLLGKKPSMRPLSTISSTGQVSLKSDNDEASTSSLSTFSETSGNESSDVNIKVSRKRKTSDIAQAIVESRKIAEEEKAKRHRERMEVKDKLMGKLDEILKKL